MEFCKVTLTFESVDKTIWCDHSNESSLPVLTHGAICFSKFHKIKFRHLVEICFWLNLAVRGFRGLYHATWYLFKKLERFSHQLNMKNNGLVLLFKTIFRHWNCFQSSVATDGKDGNGLKLEHLRPTFSSFDAMPAKSPPPPPANYYV